MRILFFILICTFSLATSVKAQDQISSYISYFRLTPVERLHVLDTTIRNKRNALSAAFYTDDIKAITGDTSDINRSYDCSGVDMRVTSFDDAKLSKVVKRWSKLLRKKRYDKKRIPFTVPDYSRAVTADDSVDFFFMWYTTLPINNRIDYFDSTFATLAHPILYAVSQDINAITGCNCCPFVRIDGEYIPGPESKEQSVELWRKAMK